MLGQPPSRTSARRAHSLPKRVARQLQIAIDGVARTAGKPSTRKTLPQPQRTRRVSAPARVCPLTYNPESVLARRGLSNGGGAAAGFLSDALDEGARRRASLGDAYWRHRPPEPDRSQALRAILDDCNCPQKHVWRAHGLAPHRFRTFKLSNE
jgi:hypothetical protein